MRSVVYMLLPMALMARTRMILAYGVFLLGLANAYVPEHISRQLLAPDHDSVTKSTLQHVVYSNPDSSKHLMLDYQAQQHMHVQLWSLDSIAGLQGVTTHHGKFA